MLNNITSYLWLALVIYAFVVAFRFHRISLRLDKVCDDLERKVAGEVD